MSHIDRSTGFQRRRVGRGINTQFQQGSAPIANPPDVNQFKFAQPTDGFTNADLGGGAFGLPQFGDLPSGGDANDRIEQGKLGTALLAREVPFALARLGGQFQQGILTPGELEGGRRGAARESALRRGATARGLRRKLGRRLGSRSGNVNQLIENANAANFGNLEQQNFQAFFQNLLQGRIAGAGLLQQAGQGARAEERLIQDVMLGRRDLDQRDDGGGSIIGDVLGIAGGVGGAIFGGVPGAIAGSQIGSSVGSGFSGNRPRGGT